MSIEYWRTQRTRTVHAPTVVTHRFKAMGGPAEIGLSLSATLSTAAAASVLRAAEQEVRRIEQKYSRYLKNNLLFNINKSYFKGPVDIKSDLETQALLAHAHQMYIASQGRFDITSGVLRTVWHFAPGAQPPTQAQIAALLPLINWPSIGWAAKPHCIQLPLPGMQIDLGGFAKEYAADRVAALLTTLGFTHGYVNLAGDVAVSGPQLSGEPWQIGIINPHLLAHAAPSARLALTQGGLATSGTTARCFTHQGQHYHHLLNAQTGWPVATFASVSVQAPSCLLAGTASTLALLAGQTEALTTLRGLGWPFLAMTDAGQPIVA